MNIRLLIRTIATEIGTAIEIDPDFDEKKSQQAIRRNVNSLSNLSQKFIDNHMQVNISTKFGFKDADVLEFIFFIRRFMNLSNSAYMAFILNIIRSYRSEK